MFFLSVIHVDLNRIMIKILKYLNYYLFIVQKREVFEHSTYVDCRPQGSIKRQF